MGYKNIPYPGLQLVIIAFLLFLKQVRWLGDTPNMMMGNAFHDIKVRWEIQIFFQNIHFNSYILVTIASIRSSLKDMPCIVFKNMT
jgi:hypothetical protein